MTSEAFQPYVDRITVEFAQPADSGDDSTLTVHTGDYNNYVVRIDGPWQFNKVRDIAELLDKAITAIDSVIDSVRMDQ